MDTLAESRIKEQGFPDGLNLAAHYSHLEFIKKKKIFFFKESMPTSSLRNSDFIHLKWGLGIRLF